MAVTTKNAALEIVSRARAELERLYGRRLRGVYLYGSAARDQLTEDSDIDIAIILDQIGDRFAEHELTSELGSLLSIAANTLVSFLFVSDEDLKQGRFAVHRAIKSEGIEI